MARKSAILTAAILSATALPYVLIGALNRRAGRVETVFFVYAGGAKYMAAYRPAWVPPGLIWRPSPIGVLRHDTGQLGLVFAAPITETDFLDPANRAEFDLLLRRLSRIARLMHVAQVNLAGILPSVLQQRSAPPALPVRNTRPATVAAILRALGLLTEEEFNGAQVPVILLGGAGYIGRAVAQALRDQGRAHVTVDPAVGRGTLPRNLQDRPCILLDVARKGALASYLPALWPQAVVLNETFPEPSRRDREAAKQRGIRLFHLSGIPGTIWPALPGGYAHAIPCCAAPDAEVPAVRVLRLA